MNTKLISELKPGDYIAVSSKYLEVPRHRISTFYFTVLRVHQKDSLFKLDFPGDSTVWLKSYISFELLEKPEATHKESSIAFRHLNPTKYNNLTID